jgi:hypothetical protein
MHTTPLHPQSDRMVESYIKTAGGHLRKVIWTYHTDWNERLPLLLPAYKASAPETIGMTPISIVFGREPCLPCDPLFGDPETRGNLQLTIWWSHGTGAWHHYALQHPKVVSDRMKACYDCLANPARFQEEYQVWLYHPTRTRRKSMKLEPSWEDP